MGLREEVSLTALPPDGYEYAFGYDVDEWMLATPCSKEEARQKADSGYKIWRRPVLNWEEYSFD